MNLKEIENAPLPELYVVEYPFQFFRFKFLLLCHELQSPDLFNASLLTSVSVFHLQISIIRQHTDNGINP
ncbi:MAG: hypothetical protein ACJAYV_000093 [Oleispira sp.]|jgi:hypothetical protein